MPGSGNDKCRWRQAYMLNRSGLGWRSGYSRFLVENSVLMVYDLTDGSSISPWMARVLHYVINTHRTMIWTAPLTAEHFKSSNGILVTETKIRKHESCTFKPVCRKLYFVHCRCVSQSITFLHARTRLKQSLPYSNCRLSFFWQTDASLIFFMKHGQMG